MFVSRNSGTNETRETTFSTNLLLIRLLQKNR
jgi:hypothetical protein